MATTAEWAWLASQHYGFDATAEVAGNVPYPLQPAADTVGVGLLSPPYGVHRRTALCTPHTSRSHQYGTTVRVAANLGFSHQASVLTILRDSCGGTIAAVAVPQCLTLNDTSIVPQSDISRSCNIHSLPARRLSAQVYIY